MKRSGPHWSVFVFLAIGVVGCISGIAWPVVRWVWSVEQRFAEQDAKELYSHGEIVVPSKGN